jgi:hypothetical protein
MIRNSAPAPIALAAGQSAAPLSRPAAHAIAAAEAALIALAVGLSDRALIGFEEGQAEAFLGPLARLDLRGYACPWFDAPPRDSSEAAAGGKGKFSRSAI